MTLQAFGRWTPPVQAAEPVIDPATWLAEAMADLSGGEMTGVDTLADRYIRHLRLRFRVEPLEETS